jgi:hypothetical protein
VQHYFNGFSAAAAVALWVGFVILQDATRMMPQVDVAKALLSWACKVLHQT